jgi:CTD small phosphatase-like protein 2
LEPSFPRVDSRAAGSLFSPNLKEEETEEQEDVKKIEIVDPENMEEDDAEDDVFNPYLFIANLPPHAWVATKGEARLPPQINERRTLVLDLDETLVHCSVDPISKPDLTFPVRFNGIFYEVYVRKRPYLDYFLETVSKTFEVRQCYLFSLRRMFF